MTGALKLMQKGFSEGKYASNPVDYDKYKNVYQVIEVSVENLTEEEKLVLYCFGGIDEDQSVDEESIGILVNLEEANLVKALLRKLIQRSLLQFTHDSSGNQAYGIHDIVRGYLRKRVLCDDISSWRRFVMNRTPLHIATQEKEVEVVKKLLQNNIFLSTYVNLIDQLNRTPLHYIAKYGNEDKGRIIGEILIARGANVQSKGSIWLYSSSSCSNSWKSSKLLIYCS